ncbi:hypothetical protein PFISCL1PPCAC_16722, partial [Pristionchus fissidentatus]
VLDTTTMATLYINFSRPGNDLTAKYFYTIIGVHDGEISVNMMRGTMKKIGRKKLEDAWTRGICKAKFPESLKNLERA